MNSDTPGQQLRRLVGRLRRRPAPAAPLSADARQHPVARLLDHMAAHDGVWFARRADIAQRWIKHHPPA